MMAIVMATVLAACRPFAEMRPPAGPPVETQCMHTLDCPEGSYCAKPVGACARAGVCAPIPKGTVCAETLGDWSAVCGCDGRTYMDPCEPKTAGINLAHEGECARGVLGTCAVDGDCAQGYFCDRFPGDCFGQGVCEPVPTACEDDSGTVCGCDGKTYRNICGARGNRVSIAHEGPCED